MDIIDALLIFALAVFISSTTLDASVDSVGLPQDFSRFDTFTQAMYDSIFAKISAKTVTITSDITVAPFKV